MARNGRHSPVDVETLTMSTLFDMSVPPYATCTTSATISPEYYTSKAFSNLWDLLPTNVDPDVYNFILPTTDRTSWLKWSVYSRSSAGQIAQQKYPRYVGGDSVRCQIFVDIPESKTISSISVVVSLPTSSLILCVCDY